ncbi:hypothetical protein ESB00_00210 [Oleiharenicola lentus]|jgi:predicted short-subunit dehydrogenase-like oxidoreductase (DUF2520 family)|uniref:Uncharacterized protein n=1 Tax=Oleiharenicola lentus TaxID=2508720 RepID=A0A4Q1C6E5_9BACT|nr:hypothetical protein [Oleiharenicola lentus]RXK54358.1 hypothetical protein ESB00_00210 [Oleiharenicola lentus]
MPVIKIHLEHAENDAVLRLAELLQVQPEDVAFAALNRLMLVAQDRNVQNDVVLTHRWRKDNLPLWADSAGSVHNYEGMSPVEPAKSKYSV